MLDESEFAEISRLHRESMQGAKAFRERTGCLLENVPMELLFRPVRDLYEQLTGMKESNENAIMHHRLSLYGPPCKHCGKPLRSPKAKLCASCMLPVQET
jgi:hypothetical protein